MKKYLIMMVTLIVYCNPVHAGMIKTTDLDKYCDYEESPRQTIIYLDQNIIPVSDRDWFKDIINKVDFLPSEPLVIMEIDKQSRTKEVFIGCYPKVSVKTLAKLNREASIFDASPERVLSDDQRIFKKKLYLAFESPMTNSGLKHMPKYEMHQHPIKSIVEALYYDSARFNSRVQKSSRIIIYSDMAENTETLPNVVLMSEPKLSAHNMVKRYPMSFNYASIYVYGVGRTFASTESLSQYEVFWRHFLNQSKGLLQSFQLQLPAYQKAVPFEVLSMSGSLLDSNDRRIATSLHLAIPTQDNGPIEAGVFSVKDHHYPLKGTFRCQSDQNNCTLKAEVLFADPDIGLFMAGDVMKLKGSVSKLTGNIGAIDETMINADGSIFSYDVVFALEE